jgi:uncharacterized membrane protein YfcA
LKQGFAPDYGLVIAAVLSAFAGALLGNRFLKKMTMRSIQWIVTIMLIAFALALTVGLL